MSTEEADIAFSAKADLSLLTNYYVTKYQPRFNLTESDRSNEEMYPLSDIKNR